MTKKAYRVRNWRQYNKSLVQRGSLTFWFSPEVVESWEKGPSQPEHGNQKYDNMVLLCGLTLRQLFGLPYRATAGLMGSLAKMLQLKVEIPDYTTLCRRNKTLNIKIGNQPNNAAQHILIDSTGLKVCGEGEWKKLKHGKTRWQLWRKLHIAMDANTQNILSAVLSESVRHDANYLAPLLANIEGSIAQITGDGAYDKKKCYRAAYQRSAVAIFPPQHNATPQGTRWPKEESLSIRDAAITFINDGADKSARRRKWKENNDYHRRSLVETMMCRMKLIFGDQLSSRSEAGQKSDILVRCYIINRMNALGLPDSMAVS